MHWSGPMKIRWPRASGAWNNSAPSARGLTAALAAQRRGYAFLSEEPRCKK